MILLRGAVARNFAMGAPESDVIRMAEIVASSMDANDRAEFESVINLVRRGRMSSGQMVNILEELRGRGSQPPAYKAPPPHLRPAPPAMPQATAKPAAAPSQPSQQPCFHAAPCTAPQQPCFPAGFVQGQPVSLWTGSAGCGTGRVVNLAEVYFDGSEWTLGKGGGGKGKGGAGRHHQGRGWKGDRGKGGKKQDGKGKDGRSGPRAPNLEVARRNMEQFMAENPHYVFEPRGEVPEDVRPIWSMLHEDRDNLCRALYKHFTQSPAEFRELLVEMAEETTWPVDKLNCIERESKANTAKNGDARSDISKMSNLSGQTTRRFFG